MSKPEQGATLFTFCKKKGTATTKIAMFFPQTEQLIHYNKQGYHLSNPEMYRQKLFFGVSLWNKQRSVIL